MKLVRVTDLEVGKTYRCLAGIEDWELLSKTRKSLCRLRTTTKYPSGQVYENNWLDTEKVYEVENEGETTMTNQLFQIKDTETYGHKLATNSAGKIVFEVKGTGALLTVDKADLIEVMPYTVEVYYLGDNSHGYSFFAKEGEVKEGDLVVCRGYSNLMIVTKVNTRSRAATKWLKGSVLSVAKVLEGEE